MGGVEGSSVPVLEVTVSTGLFNSVWANCEGVSSYIARATSLNRPDSLMHFNLLSSALNELLELAFRSHAPGASITCGVSRKGDRDRVVLRVPGNEEVTSAYRRLVSEAGGGDSAERLASQLLAGAPPSAGLSLMELAANYKARFELEISDDQQVSLITDLALEEMET
jgi:hypothetical protein